MSVESILEAVEALSPGEQVELIDRLCEKYGEQEQAADSTNEVLDELDRRVAEADSSDHPGYTWEEVVEYVKRKR